MSADKKPKASGYMIVNGVKYPLTGEIKVTFKHEPGFVQFCKNFLPEDQKDTAQTAFVMDALNQRLKQARMIVLERSIEIGAPLNPDDDRQLQIIERLATGLCAGCCIASHVEVEPSGKYTVHTNVLRKKKQS